MDRKAPILRMWDHWCCSRPRWSASQRCDRCGTMSAAVVDGVAIADAMWAPHSMVVMASNEMKAVPSDRAEQRAAGQHNPEQKKPSSQESAGSSHQSPVPQPGLPPLPPLQRRDGSTEAPAIAEVLRRLLARSPDRPLDPWLPFPQNGCTFGFGTPARPLPIGALFILWREGRPFTLPCPNCEDTLRVVSYGGLLTIGGGRMICAGCDAEFFQSWGGGLGVVSPIVRATRLGATEFAPTKVVFGGSIASDGAALLAELGLAPLRLKPQCSLSVRLNDGSRCNYSVGFSDDPAVASSNQTRTGLTELAPSATTSAVLRLASSKAIALLRGLAKGRK